MKRCVPWSDEDMAAGQALYARGVGLAEIAEALDRSYPSIAYKSSRFWKGSRPAREAAIRAKVDAWPEAERVKTLAMYVAGETFPNMVTACGRSQSFIWNFASKHWAKHKDQRSRNIRQKARKRVLPEVPKALRWRAEDEATAIRMLSEGESVAVVAKVVGRTAGSVAAKQCKAWGPSGQLGGVPNVQAWGKVHDDLLITLVSQGLPWLVIAERLGFSITTCRRRSVSLGLAKPSAVSGRIRALKRQVAMPAFDFAPHDYTERLRKSR